MGMPFPSIGARCRGPPCDVLGVLGAHVLMVVNSGTIGVGGRPATDVPPPSLHQYMVAGALL